VIVVNGLPILLPWIGLTILGQVLCLNQMIFYAYFSFNNNYINDTHKTKINDNTYLINKNKMLKLFVSYLVILEDKSIERSHPNYKFKFK
jgi:hypothetical protein